MVLAQGARLGSYDIVAPLGVGGMGEVYRALDTKLKRHVALKVLPDTVASAPDRLARFQREAEVLAALNHPNIAAIYGLEDSTEIKALVLELVEGPTLADRLAEGPLLLDEALRFSKQIAEALEAAHDQGIVHRDLKPANIKLRPDATIKVLDFGLAKALERTPTTTPSSVTQSPTITSPAAMTAVGMLLGTAAYMSPEQARGRPADKRSDIWALGCVLYEMLTARRAFEGDDVSTTLAGVLMKEPDWALVPRATPPALVRLLRRCLQKEKRQRLADASDARLEIEEVAAGTDGVARPDLTVARTGRIPWAITAIALVTAAALGVTRGVGTAVTSPETGVATSLTIEPPPGTQFINGPDRRFSISPDGMSLVFSAVDENGQSQLWLRHLDELDSRPIPGTARGVSPFFSPDSRSIGFMVDGQLRRLSLAGGLSESILNTSIQNLRGAYWTPGSTILLGSALPEIAIGEIPDRGGTPKLVTTPVSADGDQTHRFPVLLPDGRHLLYVVRANPGKHGIFVSELGQSGRRLVVRALSSFAFVQPGWLLYGDAGRLLAVPFNPTSAEVRGEPQVLAASVPYWQGSTNTEFSASSRAIVFRRGSSDARIDKISPNGTFRATVVPAGAIEGSFDVSPDGGSIAYGVVDPDTGRRGIWVADVDRRTQRRLTPPSTNAWWPVWSPDGGKLAGEIDNGRIAILRIDAPTELQFLDGIPLSRPMSWSKSGRLVVSQTVPGRQSDVVLYDVEAKRSLPGVATAANETQGALSPSGRALAYASNETGRDEVYLRVLSGSSAPVRVSTHGGSKPAWSRDGQEVYYLAPSGALMATRVTAAGTVIGEPRMLFQADPLAYFTVAPDGDLLVQFSPDSRVYPNLSVIVDWQRLLKPPQNPK